MQKQAQSTRDIYSQEAVLSKLPDIEGEGSKFIDLGFVQGASSKAGVQEIPDVGKLFHEAVDAGIKARKQDPKYLAQIQLDKANGILRATEDYNNQLLSFIENKTSEADQPAIWTQQVAVNADKYNEQGQSQAFKDAYLQRYTGSASGAMNEAYEHVQYEFSRTIVTAAQTEYQNTPVKDANGVSTGRGQKLWEVINGVFGPKEATKTVATIINNDMAISLASYEQNRSNYRQDKVKTRANIQSEIASHKGAPVPVDFWAKPISEATGLPLGLERLRVQNESFEWRMERLIKARLLKQNKQDPSVALSEKIEELYSLRIPDPQGKGKGTKFMNAFSPELDQVRASVSALTKSIVVNERVDAVFSQAIEAGIAVDLETIDDPAMKAEATRRLNSWPLAILGNALAGKPVSDTDFTKVARLYGANPEALSPGMKTFQTKLDNIFTDALMSIDEPEKLLQVLGLQENMYAQLGKHGSLQPLFIPKLDTPRGVARLLFLANVPIGKIPEVTATTLAVMEERKTSQLGVGQGVEPYNNTREHLRKKPDFMALLPEEQEQLVTIVTVLRLGPGLNMHQLTDDLLFKNMRTLSPSPYSNTGRDGFSFPNAKIPATWLGAHAQAHSPNNKGVATTALIELLHSEEVTSKLNADLGLNITGNTKLNPTDWDMSFVSRRGGGYTVRISPIKKSGVLSWLHWGADEPFPNNYIDVNGITEKGFRQRMRKAQDTMLTTVGGGN